LSHNFLVKWKVRVSVCSNFNLHNFSFPLCLGATTAIVALKTLIQNVPGTETLCHTVLHNDVTPMQGFVIEFSMGFILLFVICGVTDEYKQESRFVAPLVIGCTVILAHLAFVPYTSASMSPSGTFATAIVLGLWDDLWVIPKPFL
jgi:aquaporin rerated protein, invertebrate